MPPDRLGQSQPGSIPAGFPERITVVEVAPRDGLQNDAGTYDTEAKVAFIEALAAAGAPVIEATSFVSPKAIPKLADADEVMRSLRRRPGVSYVALVPNERGYERARAAGVDAVALFASATDAFSQANLQASIDETFDRFAPVAARANQDGVWLRGYVSVAFVCPYTGPVRPAAVRAVAERLLALQCDEIALADTIGAARPDDVHRLLDAVLDALPRDRLALHFHDTRGVAIGNVDAAIDHGITIFDSAAGGLGGCPYAPGAPGNLATELLVDHLAARGIATGIQPAGVRAALATLRASAIEA